MLIAVGVFLLSLGLLSVAAVQTFAPLDLPAVLLAAIAPRPSWLLAALAGMAAGLALVAAHRARRHGRRGLVIAALGLATASLAVALIGAWQGRAPYRRTFVQFLAADGTRLAGTLYAPDGDGARPGVVLAPGSAAAPRRAYGYAADRLCRAGFVVLVADKRGVGDSEGGYDRDNNASTATLTLLGDDLASSWRWLVEQPEVDARHTGYWGVSQAGWTVPIALQQTPDAAFAVLMSGPTTSTGEEDLWSDLAGEDADPMGSREPPMPLATIDERLASAPARGFDPLPFLERLDVPMLYVFGEWDNSVPVARSVARIAALAARGKPFAARVLPEANHLLLIARGPNRAILPSFAPEAWRTMLDWMRRQAGVLR
jgi:dienelactone hydrolase